MLINNHYHLSYCTNIHPGETWDEYFANIRQYLPAVKARVSPESSFGVGLRLSARAAEVLLLDDTLNEFKSWLSSEGLYVYTINGFPYGNFHHQTVKGDVHKPDWTCQERVSYTKNLCHILAFLLPKGVEGSISTSPIAYKPLLQNNEQIIEESFRVASVHFALVIEEMMRIRSATGKLLHLAIEPEPDGLLENTSEIISFFDFWMHPIGAQYFQQSLGLSPEESRSMILNHLRVCYDVCHFSLAYEHPEAVFSRLSLEGIKIGKIQISSALKARLSDDREKNKAIGNELSQFAESTYLHQVIECDSTGNLTLFSDLPEALETVSKAGEREWRIHFHVPIFMEKYKMLDSTQQDIRDVLKMLKQHKFACHLEVETYTWEVLPEEIKTDLVTSIERELNWVKEQLNIYNYA